MTTRPYRCASTGIVASSRVPPPIGLRTESRPPSASTRSARPRRPEPRPCRPRRCRRPRPRGQRVHPSGHVDRHARCLGVLCRRSRAPPSRRSTPPPRPSGPAADRHRELHRHAGPDVSAGSAAPRPPCVSARGWMPCAKSRSSARAPRSSSSTSARGPRPDVHISPCLVQKRRDSAEALLRTLTQLPLETPLLGVRGLDDPPPRSRELHHARLHLGLEAGVRDRHPRGRSNGLNERRVVKHRLVVNEHGDRHPVVRDRRHRSPGSRSRKLDGPPRVVDVALLVRAAGSRRRASDPRAPARARPEASACRLARRGRRRGRRRRRPTSAHAAGRRRARRRGTR